MAGQRRYLTGAAGKSAQLLLGGEDDWRNGPRPRADCGRRGWHFGVGRRGALGGPGGTAAAGQLHLVFADDHDRRIGAPYAGGWDEPRPDEDEAAATAALDAAEQQAGQALPPARLSSERAGGSPSRVLIDRSAGAEMLVLGSAYQPGRSASDVWPPMGPVTRDCLHGGACPVVVMTSCEGARAPGMQTAPRQHRVRQGALSGVMRSNGMTRQEGLRRGPVRGPAL
jgi:hypothetical protein